LTARADDVATFADALSELLAPRARVRRETDGAIAIFASEADEVPSLVIETQAAADLDARLRDWASRGADMVALVSDEPVELRVWDRFAWQLEERDDVDPAECDALGIVLSVESRPEAAVLAVTSPETGTRATLAVFASATERRGA
jgi:hypothetical protein